MKGMFSTWTKRSVTRTAATATALTLAITALVVGPASPAMADYYYCTPSTITIYTEFGTLAQGQVHNCAGAGEWNNDTWWWVWDGTDGDIFDTKMEYLKRDRDGYGGYTYTWFHTPWVNNTSTQEYDNDLGDEYIVQFRLVMKFYMCPPAAYYCTWGGDGAWYVYSDYVWPGH